MATYKMTIAGLERELPICKVNDKLDIAGFVIFGDVEITVASAAELLKKCPEFDFIVAPEAKAIPLAHEMARQSGKPYFICRKGAKIRHRCCVQGSLVTAHRAYIMYFFVIDTNLGIKEYYAFCHMRPPIILSSLQIK